MSTHGEAGWKAQLLELIAQADDPEAAFHASPWAKDPECAEWFAELRALEGRLSGAGARARADLTDAERTSGAPGEDRLRSLLLDHRSSDRIPLPDAEVETRKRFPTRTWVPWLVAAAAIVAWVAWPRPSPREDPGPVLLGGKGELVPSGETSAYAFSWTFERPPAGHFIVRVRAEEGEAGAAGTLLFTSPVIRAQEWRPDDATAASWPRRIRWELHVYDGSSPRAAAVHSATAWLE